MGDRLAGKVAIIAGAARGQGAAEARLFVAEGASVVLGDRMGEGVASLAADLNARHGDRAARAIPLDVTDESAWREAVALAQREFGGLDILVNNAGISGRAGILEMDLAEWDRILSVNQTGALLGMRAVIPPMLNRGGGAIVNVSSIYGIVAATASPAYQASKAAIRMLSRAAALEFADRGIRVNTILPGLVDTAMVAGISHERREARLKRTPMGRMASPAEIAQGVLFLASPESSFMTGAELISDGGYTAT
jgi:cyclopentanol dehydrogenase